MGNPPEMRMPDYHKPVLVKETLTLLDPKESGVFVDATLGGGGHAVEILERVGPNGMLIGIDRDPEAIEYARERLKQYGDRVMLVQGNYQDLESILTSIGITEIDGALFDLGVSSHQLDVDRGFSFQRDEELDMRMNPSENTLSAKDIVNTYSESDLADLIWQYGEERYSRRIARAIVNRREREPITRTKELAEIIWNAVPPQYRHGEIHPATRSFMSIRIRVNRELEAIEIGVPAAINALKTGGRICVISFHSLEDRIVKRLFRKFSGRCECPPRFPQCQCGAIERLKILTNKPVVANDEEIKDNPRSRSAKLRCAMRVN